MDLSSNSGNYMKRAVAIIPYSNMAPYRQLGPPPGCEWVELVPSRTPQALKRKTAWAAAIPVGALTELSNLVEPVGNFGIAADGPVRSVLLFSNRPFELLRAPCRLKLTDQSSSSVKLLYILLRHGLAEDELPKLVGQEDECDAELVIGDDAMSRRKTGPCNHVIDLAEVWRGLFEKPFVFARWVVRKDAPQDFKDTLLKWLTPMQEREDDLILATSRAEAERLDVSTAEMIAYLRGIIRVLGADELDGQSLFVDKLRQAKRTTRHEDWRALL